MNCLLFVNPSEQVCLVTSGSSLRILLPINKLDQALGSVVFTASVRLFLANSSLLTHSTDRLSGCSRIDGHTCILA